MGTAKIDISLLFHMVKKFFYKKFTQQKSKTPFDCVGVAWQAGKKLNHLAVFWGVRLGLRQKIADGLPNYRCAFAFGKTNPQRQLAFFEKDIPTVVVLTSPDENLTPPITKFFAEKGVYIMRSIGIDHALQTLQRRIITADSSLQTIVSDSSDSNDDIFTETSVYINVPAGIRDNLLLEKSACRRIFLYSKKDGDADAIHKKISTYCNVTNIYFYGAQNTSATLQDYCARKGITLLPLPNDVLLQQIAVPVLPTPLDDTCVDIALLWGVSEADSIRVAPCLHGKTVFRVETIMSTDRLCDIVSLLTATYSFAFFCGGDAIPEEALALAEEKHIPVAYLHEPLLDKLHFRQPFANPFFAMVSPAKPNKLGLPDRAIFQSWLDKQHDTSSNSEIFDRLKSLHTLLQRGCKAPELAVDAVRQRAFVLVIWHNEEGEEYPFRDFLRAVCQNIRNETVVCLILNAQGKAYSPSKKSCATVIEPSRLLFLHHAEDFDYLCQQAVAVHVVGSWYGFEALLAGCSVVTHGQPFYAGFGWTKDLAVPIQGSTYSFQDAASVALFGNDLYAPYTGEKLTPDQALVLQHLRLRSDFSYLFEQLADRLGKDERYPTLDLRRKYYHFMDPQTAEYIRDNLCGSNLGLLVHSLFNFSYTCAGLEALLCSLPTPALFRLLKALTIYCRSNSLFDMLCHITNCYVTWFAKNTFTAHEISTFYTLYFSLQRNNRYRVFDFPVYKELPEYDLEVCKIYSRIAIYSCHYTEFGALFDALPDMPLGYYTSLLSYLMEYPYGSREKDFCARIELRQKVFSAWLENTICDAKINISEKSIELIRHSLAEDLPMVQTVAAAVLDEQEKGIVVTGSVATLLSALLTAYIVRCYYPEAELFLRILSKSGLKKDVYFAQWKRLRKIADGFIPTGMTSAKRRQQIEKTIKTSKMACLQKKSLEDIFVLSSRVSDEELCLRTSEIIARIDQPERPLGYIFLPSFGIYQLPILPLLICSLAKRGYATIVLNTNYIFIQPKNQSCFHKFAYAAIERPMRLACPWEIDIENKKIVAFGINLYDRFVEQLRVSLRIFAVDINNPIQKSYLRQFIYQADTHLKICNEIYELHKKSGVPCGVLSAFLLILPQVVWLDFINAKKAENFRAIFCRTALVQNMAEGIAAEDVSICAMDMASHPEQRVPFLATREKFQAWYDEFRKEPDFRQTLTTLRDNLLCPEPQGSRMYERLLREKTAGKKIVFCYSRLLYDLGLRAADGGPGHIHMEDWLWHSIQIAAENKDIFLVIKPHPHEEDPEFAALPVEKLEDILPPLPDNVLLLPPRELKTPQLLGIADMVALWLGTAISELTALGIPVVVCSYAGITDTPFDVKTFNDREEYAQLLKTASLPLPSQDERDVATGLLKFYRDNQMVTPYPYSSFSASNDFRSLPFYDDVAVERYFVEGDPQIEHIVDQILEGFPSPKSNG